MCLAGAVVASLHKRWLGGKFQPFYCNKYFCRWIQRIQWKHLENLQYVSFQLMIDCIVGTSSYKDFIRKII